MRVLLDREVSRCSVARVGCGRPVTHLAIHGDASSEGADIQRLRKPSLEHLRAVMYPLGRRDTGACTR